MYKLLLATRYLRTRFIALASVISVTLGVATMIVVNSVMTGFSTQMKDRIHGILADVMVETTSTDGAANPIKLMSLIDEYAGNYIAHMTPTVEIYGMMSFDYVGETVNRPVTLIGIVPDGKDAVSPLAQYLLSRQAYSNGDYSRPPLRNRDEPLDWELADEYQESRRKWVEFRRDFEAMHRLTSSAAEAGTVNPVNGVSSDGDKLEHAAGEDPFSDPFADPFSHAQPTTPLPDPMLPEPARVYVGAGLISFPYKDKDTGQSMIMEMVRPGEDVSLTTIKTGTPQPASFKATVVDVFKSGMSEYDSSLVFCNLEELQVARGMLSGPDPRNPHANLDWRSGEVTSIQIRLKDYSECAEVVGRLRANLPMGQFQVRTWEQKQGPLLEAVAVESAILNVLLFLIIAVAGFGILAIFYMIVVEKTRDIGILKALGASSRGVMVVFLSYGLSLGLVGSGAGVILGLPFVRYINQIEGLLSAITGRKVFDETIYYFKEIPVVVQPGMVLWVALGAISIAVLASVLPARRASRLHPVQALRYE